MQFPIQQTHPMCGRISLTRLTITTPFLVLQVVIFIPLNYTKGDAIMQLHIVFFLCVVCHISGQNLVPCPLTWVPSFSDTSISNSAVFTQKNRHAVIAATLSSSAEEIGRFSVSESDELPPFGFIPSSNDTEAVHQFSALTNSLGCQLSWVERSDSRVGRYGVNRSGKLVGRAMSADNLLPASVTGNVAVIVDLEDKRQTTNTFFVLISYNNGLQLTLKDFEFGEMQYGSDDVYGHDQLINHADVDVMYSVSHSKITTDTVTITESHSTTKSWQISAQVSCSMQFKFKGVKGSVGGGIGVDFSRSSESGWESSLTHSQTREISVARSVFVPPRTSIVACSTSSAVDNAQVPYSCLAEYTSPGLNGSQVLENVIEFFPNAIARGNTAVVIVEGVFQGSLTVSSTFTIQPFDAFNPCTSLASNSV